MWKLAVRCCWNINAKPMASNYYKQRSQACRWKDANTWQVRRETQTLFEINASAIRGLTYFSTSGNRCNSVWMTAASGSTTAKTTHVKQTCSLVSNERSKWLNSFCGYGTESIFSSAKLSGARLSHRVWTIQQQIWGEVPALILASSTVQ